MRTALVAAVAAACISAGSAYLTDPPSKADPSTPEDCSWWYQATGADAADSKACASIAAGSKLSTKDFESTYVRPLNLSFHESEPASGYGWAWLLQQRLA